MLSSDLILKLRGLPPEARQLLLYVSNRTGDKFINIGKLKEDTHYTNEVIEKTLIKLANINIIDKEHSLIIMPLIKKLYKDEEELKITLNTALLKYLIEHKTNIKEFIEVAGIQKVTKKTCLLFALLVDSRDWIDKHNGLRVDFPELKALLQIDKEKYLDTKDPTNDIQKQLIRTPIRAINKTLTSELDPDLYIFTYPKDDKKHTSVVFSLVSDDMESIEL
jgi:hypothetical protein